MTEIPTQAGKLYLATVIDLYSRRLLGAATGLHPDADLACQPITMAVAARGGNEDIRGLICHTDRGSTYTATTFTKLCRRLTIRQSLGRVGSRFDNAAAEAFFSSLEWGALSKHDFADPRQAQAVAIEWCYDFHNHQRRHSAADMQCPINYENIAAFTEKRHEEPSTISGESHQGPTGGLSLRTASLSYKRCDSNIGAPSLAWATARIF